MVTCKSCLLKFNTEQELNVHTKQCQENVQSPLPGLSSSKSHICKLCQRSFMTTEELVAHVNACEVKFGTMMISNLETMENVVESLCKKFEQKTLGQCYYCSQKLHTVEKVIEHRKTCKVLLMGNIIEEMYRKFRVLLSDEQSTMTSISPPSPKPLSKDSKEKKSPKKRVLDTGTDRDRATESESSPETSPPPSKMFCSSDKDITDIKTKETFECPFCSLKLQSLDALKTHILQCYKTYKI